MVFFKPILYTVHAHGDGKGQDHRCDFNGRICDQLIPECTGPNGEEVINHNGIL
jgi:hypothetical protein